MKHEIGNRVQLSERVFHPQFRGLCGTVKKVIKSRCLVDVLCDNGQSYQARPENVIKIATGE